MVKQVFGVDKSIIGMVHLKKLPGQRGYRGISYVVQRAISDALLLERSGLDAICIENWEDESPGPFVDYKTTCYLEAIIREVVKQVRIPLGINILPNDYRTAFKIASNLWPLYKNPRFVWLDVMVDHVRTDFSYGSGPAFEVKVDLDDLEGHREGLWGVMLLASIHPKHYLLLEKGKTLAISASQAIHQGANALVITKSTGAAPDATILKSIKKFAGDFPVFLGSGLTPENTPELLPLVDGAIVGTALKDKNFNRLVESKVRRLMKEVAKIKGR